MLSAGGIFIIKLLTFPYLNWERSEFILSAI